MAVKKKTISAVKEEENNINHLMRTLQQSVAVDNLTLQLQVKNNLILYFNDYNKYFKCF